MRSTGSGSLPTLVAGTSHDENEAQHELTTRGLRLRGIDHDIVWLDDANAAAVLAEFF